MGNIYIRDYGVMEFATLLAGGTHMPRGPMNYLFNENDMFAVLDAQHKAISAHVQGLQSNTLLSRPTEDIVADIVERLKMDVPVLRRDEAHAEQNEAQVRAHDFYDDYGRGQAPLSGSSSWFS